MLRYRAGERMTELSREYGVSRKTGYKYVERYEARAMPGSWTFAAAQSRRRRRWRNSS
ncbi:MAG: helix-turn-helix domain-containing protein [Myxococcales bacterium]|nr:helix-turn-helix domain-containing protein [Myxococcales bacterium]